MERVFDIGTRREVFWDDYLVDLRYTTAERILHHPVRKEVVMKCSEAWEGDCCYFFNVLKDDDRYRMYYEARNTPEIYAVQALLCGESGWAALGETVAGDLYF